MSAHLYPVTETGINTVYFTVTVDGAPAPLDTARVSAMPFNRRWPGHQRGIEQTEFSNFLSLSQSGRTVYRVTPEKPFTDFAVRPNYPDMTVECDGKTITVTTEEPHYFTVEPWGRHNALQIFADPPEEDRPAEAGEIAGRSEAVKPLANGGRCLYFGAGEHDVGRVDLHSGDTLYLDEGCVLYGIVRAEDAQNIRICGRGIIDASKVKETILYEANVENNEAAVENAKREHTVALKYCDNVLIEGVTIRDSLAYNIQPVCCRDVEIRNVKIVGQWRYNSDGIDMHNCERVHIHHCFIRTFDDSICAKGFDCWMDPADMVHNGVTYDLFSDLTVENCVIWNDWCRCLEIGAETRAEEIRNVTFRNCDLIHVCHMITDCSNVDYAHIHDILYDNITIHYDEKMDAPRIQKSDSDVYDPGDGTYEPSLFRLEVMYHPEYSAGGERRGKVSRLTVSNLTIDSKYPPRVELIGYDAEHGARDVRFCNIVRNGKRLTAADVNFRQNEFVWNVTIE